MALASRRSSDDYARATRLLAGGHRLAHAPENLATDGGRLRIKLCCFEPIWFTSGATNAFAPLPSDLASAQAMILAERAAGIAAEAGAETAKVTRRGLDIEIERLKLEI